MLCRNLEAAGQSSGPGRPSAVAAHEETVAEPLSGEQRMVCPHGDGAHGLHCPTGASRGYASP